jgi:glycosyltransferase involved in cell wall biosynthesis
MKVLIVGSDSIHLSNYIAGLKEQGVNFLFLSQDTGDFPIHKDFILNGKKLNPISIIRNLYRLFRIIKKTNPNVVHIHQANRTGFWVSFVCKALKTPILLTTWGSDVLVSPKQSKLKYFVARQSLKWADIITADANIMIDSMLQMENEGSKYVKLQYGINLQEVNAEKEKIIYSNRLWYENYNISDVLSLFFEFADTHEDWKLVLSGKGDLESHLKSKVNLSRHSSKVFFAGWVTQKENLEWYGKSSIYVSIPKSDGTSVSVLESMSAGCIPVLSDIPVSHEWIEDGVTGCIYDLKENPFVKALLLDTEVLITLNKEKTKWVSRENCIKEFIKLYTKLTSLNLTQSK